MVQFSTLHMLCKCSNTEVHIRPLECLLITKLKCYCVWKHLPIFQSTAHIIHVLYVNTYVYTYSCFYIKPSSFLFYFYFCLCIYLYIITCFIMFFVCMHIRYFPQKCGVCVCIHNGVLFIH